MFYMLLSVFCGRQYFAVGMLLGLPLSVKSKSYWPFTFAAIAGSALDYMEVRISAMFDM